MKQATKSFKAFAEISIFPVKFDISLWNTRRAIHMSYTEEICEFINEPYHKFCDNDGSMGWQARSLSCSKQTSWRKV